MSNTYNNVPMSESERKRVERQDAAWTGPKLVFLCIVTLLLALALLWALADGRLTPLPNQ